MSENFDWIDRERGVLTKKDREILLGREGHDLNQNALNQRYYNIRNRVKNSILDFYLLAQYLPVPDIQQIFEPAYDWSRERRRLNEDGRTSTQVEISPYIWGWLGAIEFFSYGMYAGGKQETQILMEEVLENGIERGYRQYRHDNRMHYREIDAEITLKYGNLMVLDNFLGGLRENLSTDPEKATEEVMRLHNQRKIPDWIASDWMDEMINSSGF